MRAVLLACVLCAAPAHAQITTSQLDQLNAAGACTIRPTGGAAIYARIRDGGLSHAEALFHAASRLGYGASPVGPLVISRANDCTTVFVADELARQIATLGSTADTAQLQTIRRGVMPLTTFPRPDLSAALWRLRNTSAEGTSAAGTLGWEARQSLAALKTLRELVGSQRVEGGRLVDVQLGLHEVMLELWLNHFNVELEKAGYHAQGSNGFSEVMRRAQGGTFAALLRVAMQQPAMLVYLDNQANACDPVTGVASNQNLARELLELHTLGVGPTAGVYTQADVRAVASVLCGWNAVGTSTPLPSNGTELVWNDMLASDKTHTIMGTSFAPDGANRVLAVLDFLASRSHTRQAVCTKLAARFYAPALRADAALACVSAWGSSGNLPVIVRALVQRDAFWSPANYRKLQRTPVELVVAVARAMGLRLTDLSDAVTAAGLTAAPFTPSEMQPSVVDDLAALRAAPPFKAVGGIVNRIEVMLGVKRMRVAPPTGYPLDGAAFLSPSYIDDASRLGLEVGAALNQLADRRDLSSSAERSAVDAQLAATTAAATVEWFLEKRLQLGNVVSTVTSAVFAVAPAHKSLLDAVLGNRAAWAVHVTATTVPRSHDTLLGMTLGSSYTVWR